MKKGIIVVSFGTSYEKTRKLCIESIENRIKEEFNSYEVRRAFTSKIVRKILKERDGIVIDSVNEALEKMHEENFDEVIIQSLHVISGHEFGKIVNQVQRCKEQNIFSSIKLGRPLLIDDKDYEKTIEALEYQNPNLKKDEAIVFMGHGTDHSSDICYSVLQELYKEANKNIFIATVEGDKTLNSIIPELKKNKVNRVILMPFMIVAGDHAQNDMAGDNEDSWKSILKKEGFRVDVYMHGLGENKCIQDMFVSHLKDVINIKE